jgi:putative phosphoribosyl transferase
MMRFTDRREAGRKLAQRLSEYRGQDVMVLAIPRGGVVAGFEVAEALDAPLDVIVPRKLGAPNEPELAIGAVASWGDHDRVIDEQTVRMLNVPREYIERESERQLEEIRRRLMAYRVTTAPPDVKGKTTIVVDDGIATGSTVMAAVIALRRLQPAKIVLAVPVSPPEAAYRFRGLVDQFVAIETPTPFYAVGYWYENFEQTSDEEVVNLLHARAAAPRE